MLTVCSNIILYLIGVQHEHRVALRVVKEKVVALEVLYENAALF